MSIPIYKKVQNYILEKIENNEYSEGEQIPTEQELSQLFNASRMTINRAITELSRQNILKRIQGSGTFVMPKKAIYKERSARQQQLQLDTYPRSGMRIPRHLLHDDPRAHVPRADERADSSRFE